MISPSDDAKLEVLATHYENTFQEISKTLARRDRSFLILVLVLIFFWLRLVMPADVAAATTDLAQNKLGLKYVPKIFVVDSVLWCALLGICTRYFQCTVESNRLYNYIQSIEAELKALFAGAPFTREGDFYSNNYNLFKRWAGFVYTVIFPLFMCITIVVKMVSEIIIRESIANALFDLAICAIVLISIVLFVWRDLIVQFGRKQE